MSYSLIVWEDGDGVRMFLIPNEEVAPDERQILQVAHGCYQNVPGISDQAELAIESICDLLASDWHKYSVYDSRTGGNEICGNITNVYVTGAWE